MGGDLARRDAQAHHEAVLRRGDVEEAVKLEAEGVGLVGKLVGGGVGDELLPDVEAVFLVLPALGLGEVGEGRAENRIFGGRGEVTRLGGAGRASQLAGGGGTDVGVLAAGQHACHEALQVFLLVGREGIG